MDIWLEITPEAALELAGSKISERYHYRDSPKYYSDAVCKKAENIGVYLDTNGKWSISKFNPYLWVLHLKYKKVEKGKAFFGEAIVTPEGIFYDSLEEAFPID